MKVQAYILFFVVVLLAPFALRATIGRGPAVPVASAEAPRLVIVTPNNQDIREEFARAYSEWHRAHYGTGVTCDFRVPGGTNDIRRQLEMTYRGARDAGTGELSPGFDPGYDVVWGGGDYFFDQELKPLHLLQPVGMDPAMLREAFPEPTLAGVRLYDSSDEPQWVGVALSSFGIVYNPDVYDALGMPLPRTWSDLTDPRLFRLLSLADPTHSGSVAVAYMVVIQRAMADEEQHYLAARPGIAGQGYKSDPAYRAALAAGWKRGMGELLLMAANARAFTASSTQVPADVASGDAAAGVAIDLYARVTAEVVGPRRARFVAPANATALTPDPVAILAGVSGERLTLSRHFVEFLLSREGQLLWALKVGVAGGPRDRALRRLPVRRDVYADRAGWSDPDDDPFGATAGAGGFNQRGEWMGQFTELRPIWRAAWIDARDELQAAYADVLAVGDEARRGALIARLADLPVEMGDVDAIRAERKRILAAGGDVDQWKARQQIVWADRFRAHYDAVRAEARHGR